MARKLDDVMAALPKDREADRELRAQKRAQRRREIEPSGGFEMVPLN